MITRGLEAFGGRGGTGVAGRTSHRPTEHRSPAMNRSVRRTVAALGVIGLTSTGAVLLAPSAGATAGLTAFGDCADFGRWAREAMTPGMTDWGWARGGYAIASMAAGAAVAEDSSALGAGAGGLNVQESGVGESGTALAQDGLLVTVAGTEVVVLDVSGDAPRRLGSVALPLTPDVDGYAPTASLLLTGSGSDLRATVMSQRWAQDVNGFGSVQATVVDLADPSSPGVVGSTELVGSLVDARASDGVVRLVVSADPVLPWVQPDYSTTWTEEDSRRAVAANQAVLDAASDTSLLPQRVVRAQDGSVSGLVPALDCTAVAHPDVQSGAGVVTVTSIAPSAVTSDDDVQAGAVGITAATDLVYSSPERLYLATTAGGWAVPVDAVGTVAPADEPTTQVHGFALDGTATTHVASGEVPGRVLGRWAFSARDGFLRVATTTGETWAAPDQTPDSRSSLTVLAETDGRLDVVGSVEGLGAGESIQAVRYDGDRAYVVTFRRTDPLYVLDLSDPRAPRQTGELKVDGYSAYLHPIGDGRLLGVGQDADPATGRTRGVQVQAVDVADPANPRQTGLVVVPESNSMVEYDSRAFSYDPAAATAVLPVDLYSGVSSLRSFTVVGDGSVAELAGLTVSESSQNSWTGVEQIVSVGTGRIALVTTTQTWSENGGGSTDRQVRLLDTRTLTGGDSLSL
jgi:hypothetical protein